MPVRAIVTEGTRHDSTQAAELIEGIEYECSFADKAYDANAIISVVLSADRKAVIPPKKNRLEKRTYDKHLYKLRHLVEKAFLRMKEWPGFATRYVKNVTSFIAIVQIQSMMMWARLI